MARIDTDLLGLQIVALDNAMVVGEVDGLLIDDATVKVAGFLVDLGLYEASVLPFESAHAVGLDAVVVESAAKIALISASPTLEALAEKDVTISEAKAITRSGSTVGTIGDFFVDTETGDVVGMEFIAVDQTVYPREAAVIPVSTVYRLGRDLVVLEDDYDKHLLKDDTSLDRVSRPRSAEIGPLTTSQPEGPVDAGEEPVDAGEEPAAEAPAAEAPAAEAPAAEEPPAEEPPAEAPAAAEIDEAFETITLPEPTAEQTVVEEPAPSEHAEVPQPEEEPEESEPAGLEAEVSDDTLTSEPALTLPGAELETPAPGTATEPGATEDAFMAQQKHFLIGKRVIRRIETPGGEVIAEEGESVTFEMIQRAKGADQLLILSLNVE